MCCCETGEHHHHQHHGSHRCECGCSAEHGEHAGCCHDGGHHGFRRCYRGKAEVIPELESYLAELKAEAQAVEERLNELRS
jgi:hypothetical protein